MIRNCSNSHALCALLVGAATFCLGLGNPAVAADVKSPRDAASGQSTGKRTHEPIKLEECDDKVAEIEQLLASISVQMGELEARCAELSSLSAEADAELASLSAESESSLAAIEDAQKIFDEQVASFLDSSTSALVTQNLETLRLTATATFSDGTSEDVTSSVAPVQENLDSLKATFDSFVQLCAQVRAEVSEKHTKTGHVTLLK